MFLSSHEIRHQTFEREDDFINSNTLYEIDIVLIYLGLSISNNAFEFINKVVKKGKNVKSSSWFENIKMIRKKAYPTDEGGGI